MNKKEDSITQSDRNTSKASEQRALKNNTASVKQVNGYSSDMKKDKICFKIVPVKIKGPLNEIETYAFLDSGSDTTLCLQSLLDELGIQSKSSESDYNIRTISGDSSVSAKEVDLKIFSLKGDSHFLLNNVLTTPLIPVDEENLISPSEVRKWPHLEHLDIQHVPFGKVTLLIGMDHPEIIENQLEVRRGKRNEPIGIKTPLGWTICGTVGKVESKPGSRKVNFLVSSFEKSVSDQLDKLYNTDK